MKLLRSYGFPLLLLLLVFSIIIFKSFTTPSKGSKATTVSSYNAYNNEWQPPDETTMSYGDEELIRYGRELINNTAFYLGPKGIVAAVSNGMNCQNCHINGGTQLYGNCFSAVAANYPRYRDRSGIVETIEFRINDCLMRSLNGQTIDEESKEMKAMVSYLKWLGKDVPQTVKPKGAGVAPLPFLTRAADTAKGRVIYDKQCSSCHGLNGEGIKNSDGIGFKNPPLWGGESYNTGAGLYRLSQFAAYVKSNMPYGTTYVNPQLSNEEAWDVAAFVNSQPRPHKPFLKDWPDITKKPPDHPFGPYADSFAEAQHKYGPFAPIKNKR